MACCPTEEVYGYEDSRFEKDVDEDFHCSICYNVLKEPRMCRNNEHIFCHACISHHLMVNSQTCPECNEHLSIDMLRRPRVVNNYLSKLKINCDHASRGCPEFICLEQLKTHVATCGYAPVLCSNAECGMVINKQDKAHHETEVCVFRKVPCRDCEQIHEVVKRLEESLLKLDSKVEAARRERKTEIEEFREKTKKTDKNVQVLIEMNKKMNDKVEAVKVIHAESRLTNHEIGQVKEEVKDLKNNLNKVNKDVDVVKVMMTRMLEKLNMLEQHNKPPSLTEKMLNVQKQDILITGGYVPSRAENSKSTEIFSWEKNGWFEVSAMNENHKGASSFVHKDHLHVVGGGSSRKIEICDLNELPVKWMKFAGELPYKCDEHQTVVYKQNVIHIGGYNWDKRSRSDVISQLQLASPCVMKELCRMPEPRGDHSVEVVDDSVLILGGCGSDDTLDSVLEFDPTRNECRKKPKLPIALRRMATVSWMNEVIVLGGRNKNDHAVNNVFAYNCKTGKIKVLPSMLEKRESCCAVITAGNTIVVMGGWNDKDKYLNTVECFTMGESSAWQYLPAMNKARIRAVAEVLPFRRKYV